jgi:hypothetical protein
MKYLVAILAVALGVAAITYGGADDSPGLQLIGVLIIVGAVVVGVRIARRSRYHTSDLTIARLQCFRAASQLLISARRCRAHGRSVLVGMEWLPCGIPVLLLEAMLVAPVWRSMSRPLAVPHRTPELFGARNHHWLGEYCWSNPTHGRGAGCTPYEEQPLRSSTPGSSERRDSQHSPLMGDQ